MRPSGASEISLPGLALSFRRLGIFSRMRQRRHLLYTLEATREAMGRRIELEQLNG